MGGASILGPLLVPLGLQLLFEGSYMIIFRQSTFFNSRCNGSFGKRVHSLANVTTIVCRGILIFSPSCSTSRVIRLTPKTGTSDSIRVVNWDSVSFVSTPRTIAFFFCKVLGNVRG
jgi:hypothetical protein